MKKRETVSSNYMICAIAFCVCIVASNLLETKPFHVYDNFNLTCGFLIFPISYILNDCITEVWGFSQARRVIWLGFIMNLFVVIMGWISCLLPPIEKGADEHFNAIFSFAPQIVVASMLAFLAGSFINAYVMHRMKQNDKERRFGLRAILSTLIGESADSIIYFPLAFYFFPSVINGRPYVTVSTMFSLMISQIILKTLYEILVLPFTRRVVAYLKATEISKNEI